MAGVTYVVVLLLLVMTPISWVLNRLTVRLYVVGAYDLHQRWLLPEHVGYLLNVLLFVPFGALVVLIARWPWWPGSAGCSASAARWPCSPCCRCSACWCSAPPCATDPG